MNSRAQVSDPFMHLIFPAVVITFVSAVVLVVGYGESVTNPRIAVGLSVSVGVLVWFGVAYANTRYKGESK